MLGSMRLFMCRWCGTGTATVGVVNELYKYRYKGGAMVRLGVLQLIRLMSRRLILIHDGGMIIDVRYLCGE
jgi:hypothetical protein